MHTLASEAYAAFEKPESVARIEAFLDWLASRRQLRRPVRVLDVGCGPGRMFAAFRRLNWDAVGMEPDDDFRAAAAGAAEETGYAAPRRGGFLDIDAADEFDVVTAINGPFAHLLTPAEQSEALARVCRALRPGGVVLLDVPNFLWILRNYRAPEAMHARISGGEVHLSREHVIDYAAAVFTTIEHYDLVRDGCHHPTEKIHAYGMSTPPELTQHLLDAGFVDVDTYASWDARAAEHLDGPRMIFSARR